MQSGLFLNVVVRESATILQLLASKDQTLLIRWNAFFVLDLGLDVINGVACLNVKSDGFAGQGLHEDLHAATKTENKMQSGLFLNVVVRESATILQLLASKDQALLIGWNAF